MTERVPQSATGMKPAGEKRAFPALLRAFPFSWCRRLCRGTVTALFYHTVSDERLPHIRHLFAPYSPGDFEAHLRFLKSRGCLLEYAELEHSVATGRAQPAGAFHLSFDDGYAECRSMIEPLLRKHGLPGTFFVTTDWIDNRRMFYRNKISLVLSRLEQLEREGRAGEGLAILRRGGFHHSGGLREVRNHLLRLTWADEARIDHYSEILGVDIPGYLKNRRPYLTAEQIRQMASDGWVIGAHGRSHALLANLDGEAAEAEIVDSARQIREITGAPIIPFSFPFSRHAISLERLASLRRRHPFMGLFFDSGGLGFQKGLVVRRVWAERRGETGKGSPTCWLAARLHQAWAEALWDRLFLGGQG